MTKPAPCSKGCRPFHDIKTPKGWEREGRVVRLNARPLAISKSEVYCRCQLEAVGHLAHGLVIASR